MYYIIVVVVLLALIFLLVEVIFYNQFQMARIRMSEAENHIDILLQKKFSLLERTIKIIENFDPKYQEEQILSNLIKIKNKKLNNFLLNQELEKAMAEYHGLLDLEPKLSEVEALTSISFELIDIDNDLTAAKKYYNDTIVAYNKLVKCFPSNFISAIFHYSKKEFYSEKKEEVLEILKETKKNKE